MMNYKTNIFLMSVMLLLAACSSEGKDSRFTENPVSHVTAPEVGELVKEKQTLWNFDTMKDWVLQY